MNPFMKSPSVPNLIELVAQSTVVASRQSQERAMASASLYLKPPVEAFGALQFSAHDELYRIGYEHAREQLANWSLRQAICATSK